MTDENDIHNHSGNESNSVLSQYISSDDEDIIVVEEGKVLDADDIYQDESEQSHNNSADTHKAQGEVIEPVEANNDGNADPHNELIPRLKKALAVLIIGLLGYATFIGGGGEPDEATTTPAQNQTGIQQGGDSTLNDSPMPVTTTTTRGDVPISPQQRQNMKKPPSSENYKWEVSKEKIEPLTIPGPEVVDAKTVSMSIDNMTGKKSATTESSLDTEINAKGIAKLISDYETQLNSLDSKITKLINQSNTDIRINVNKKINALEKRLSQVETSNHKKTKRTAKRISRPDIEVLSIGHTEGCFDCIDHARVIHNAVKHSLAEGDSFLGLTVSIKGDRLVLHNHEKRYSYYPKY